MDNYVIHAVIIKKPIDLNEAKRISQDFIKNKNRTFYRETNSSYRFRNIPKTKFIKDSYRTQKINNYISVIYGKLI